LCERRRFSLAVSTVSARSRLEQARVWWYVNCVRLESLERDNVENTLVCGRKDHRSGDSVVVRT
jgi:hypothetical protein